MHQLVYRLGLRPRPHWGSLQRSPDPLAGLGGGPRGKGRRQGKGGRGGEVRGGSPGMSKSIVGKPNQARGRGEARLEQTQYPFEPINLLLFGHKITLYRVRQ